MILPAYVSDVLAALRAAGRRGYLVGGSLRDMLRGETPHDFDLTTNATPEEMLEIFSDFRTILTGVKHGTVTVISDGNPVEVTTHRVDGTYKDSRHPTEVSFTRRLEEDLSRRDFTVNAMAWSEETGLVDLFGGQQDLADKILRAVGDPTARFTEDALRILRLFRFSSQLDFRIDPVTRAGAIAARAGLSHISVERIFTELQRMLVGPAAARAVRDLGDCGCFPYVLGDEFQKESDRLDSPEILEKLPADAALRLAALLFPSGEDVARAVCRRLRTSNDFSATVCGILRAATAPLPQNDYEARRLVCGSYHYWKKAMTLLAVRGTDVTAAAERCARVTKDRTAVDLHRLAVNGKELQERAGVAPPDTAKMLHRLQDAVWRDPTQNKKSSLLALAAAWVGEIE